MTKKKTPKKWHQSCCSQPFWIHLTFIENRRLTNFWWAFTEILNYTNVNSMMRDLCPVEVLVTFCTHTLRFNSVCHAQIHHVPHYFRAHRNTCVLLCISALVARLRTSRKLNKNFNLKMLTTLQQNFNLQVLTTLLLPLPLLPPPPEIVTPTSRICYAGETKTKERRYA